MCIRDRGNRIGAAPDAAPGALRLGLGGRQLVRLALDLRPVPGAGAQPDEARCRQVDAEIALGKLPACEGSEPVSLAQIQTVIGAVAAEDPDCVGRIGETLAAAKALSESLADKVGSERAPDFKPLLATLHAVQQVCPLVQAVAATEGEPAKAGAVAGEARPISGDIRSRQDALLMIDKIVAYFERNEPTNPAPLLLKRAKRLINMSFVDIIKDMVPESMQQIETIAGLGREE